MSEFKSVFSANGALLTLLKLFHFRPITLNFLEKVADIYGKLLVTQVVPSATRWNIHDCTCKSLCKGYKQFLHTFDVCVNEHSEPGVLGIFSEITDRTFIATILMLRDISETVHPLNLILQKGDGSLCLADVPVYINKTLQGLKKLQNPDCCKWCQEKKFSELKKHIMKRLTCLRVQICVTQTNLILILSYKICIYFSLKRFTEEITEVLKQLDFWLSFIIFDPRKLRMDAKDFTEYDMLELDNLSEWYGEAKIDCMNQEVSHQPADIDPVKLKLEWQSFLSAISEQTQDLC